MMAQRVLQNLLRAAVLFSLVPLSVFAQGIQPVRPVNPSGAGLLPSAFASADNIAAQTATALHGLMFVWDAGGGNWDRWTGAVTGSGNFTVVQGIGTNLHIVCDSGCGGAATFADDDPFTFGTTAINISGGVLDDTGTVACTENSACAPRITAQKALHANLRNNAGTEIGTAGAPIRVDPTGTTTQPVSGTTFDGIIKDGTGDTTQANVASGRLSVDAGSVTIGTFPDNEPFNVAQINGVTPLMGNGVTGTGSLRVTIASDNTAFSVNGSGTLAHDGAAAATNRLGTLPAIARSTYQGLTDGRNEALQVGSETGNLLVAAMPDSSVASYSAAAVVASAASATDISVIPGNATNTVLVTELRVSCTQTTAGIIELHVIKRSSADSGGTSAGMTEVPDDANYAAASSALLTYTANPTINGTVGDIDIVKLGCMATGTATPNDIYIGNFRQKPIVLRGTAQQLAVNLNSVTVTGGSFTIMWKWLETTGP